MIELTDVSIKYGALEVIHPINLKIEEGEFFTLLGPSGCGKTTMLRAIAGFVPVANGSVTINGQDVTNVPPEKRDVGIVFQNYALFPHMSVAENVAFGLKVARKPRGEISGLVDEILDTTGILDQKQKKPAELSGGQQQRVAIARSLIMGTKVLLFDEPLSNLDAKVRDDMRHEIKRLQREIGFTAVFVTHDQEEALSLSDRLLVFNDGTAEQIGGARDLYERPETPFVCEFIGTANELGRQACSSLDLTPNARHFVRPEHIKVTTDNGPRDLNGTVIDVDYLGPTTRVLLDIAGEKLTTLSVSSPKTAQLELRQEVGVSLDKSNVFSFAIQP